MKVFFSKRLTIIRRELMRVLLNTFSDVYIRKLGPSKLTVVRS